MILGKAKRNLMIVFIVFVLYVWRQKNYRRIIIFAIVIVINFISIREEIFHLQKTNDKQKEKDEKTVSKRNKIECNGYTYNA